MTGRASQLVRMIGAAVLFVSAGANAQAPRPSIIMPASAAPQLKQLCSRRGPQPFESTWQPSSEDVRAMEARLPDLSKLKSKEWISGINIQHPERYLRQYFGIIVDGRKLIYINASCGSATPPHDWTERILDACDGGACHWGAVYDPADGTFGALETNGVA